MEEEDFFELYKRNLITINNLIEWNGDTVVSQMFSKSMIKPNDMKSLVSEESINVQKIKETLNQNKLSDEQKVMLVYTTFDREEDEALRLELLQTLNLSGDFVSPSQNQAQPRNINPDSKKQNKNRYFMDPCYKMQLLTLIDKDYTYSITKDGHLIIECPNLNKVIIEKMFRKNIHGNIEIADSAATYILSSDIFNASNLISRDNKIDRSKLYLMCQADMADRYYHTKNWGDTLKKAFNLEHSNRYNEDTKKEIDEVIERIKKTRKLKEI